MAIYMYMYMYASPTTHNYVYSTMFDCCITLRYGSKKDCRSDAWRFHGDDHLTTVVSCTTVLSQVSAVSGLSSSVSDS